MTEEQFRKNCKLLKEDVASMPLAFKAAISDLTAEVSRLWDRERQLLAANTREVEERRRITAAGQQLGEHLNRVGVDISGKAPVARYFNGDGTERWVTIPEWIEKRRKAAVEHAVARNFLKTVGFWNDEDTNPLPSGIGRLIEALEEARSKSSDLEKLLAEASLRADKAEEKLSDFLERSR